VEMGLRRISRILLAEADEGLRGAQTELLRTAGHEVPEAVGSQELLTIVQFCLPHLVLFGTLPTDAPSPELCRCL